MIKTGCYTALITPFTETGELDIEGFEQLIDFQIENNITGILAAGTTGESPTLKWDEHNQVITLVAAGAKGKCLSIAGAGSNNTEETLGAVKHAADAGADAVLLVDPYYNGPSSLEIRREYITPVAEAFPEMEIIPYIIPGRTGTQLLPEDLAILADTHKNIASVKEATGNLDNMKLTRKCCGKDFRIISGDDGLTFQMMTDPEIEACGAISVISNIVPGALAKMIMLLDQGKIKEADKLHEALKPLLNLVTIITQESTPYGEVTCRARNPLAIKTLMKLLGVPSGHCRKPMGKMTKKGFDIVINTALGVQADNPWLFRPIAEFFNIDIQDRLENPEFRKDLCYTD